jgi:hypothetical protein
LESFSPALVAGAAVPSVVGGGAIVVVVVGADVSGARGGTTITAGRVVAVVGGCAVVGGDVGDVVATVGGSVGGSLGGSVTGLAVVGAAVAVVSGRAMVTSGRPSVVGGASPPAIVVPLGALVVLGSLDVLAFGTVVVVGRLGRGRCAPESSPPHPTLMMPTTRHATANTRLVGTDGHHLRTAPRWPSSVVGAFVRHP